MTDKKKPDGDLQPAFKMKLPSRVALAAEHAAKTFSGEVIKRTDYPPVNYASASPNDFALANKIAIRAAEIAQVFEIIEPITEVAQDILTIHCNCTPLNLLQFLMSDNSDFVHDYAGIRRHIDRKTGQLMNGFVCTFAAVKQ